VKPYRFGHDFTKSGTAATLTGNAYVDVVLEVLPEVLCWGFGTALGELPP